MNQRTAIIFAACMFLSGGNSGAMAFTSPISSHTQSSATSMNMSNSRRDFLTNLAPLVAGATFTVATTSASALDFDAFANSEIENDTKKCDPKQDPKCIPKLSDDEALCQYGGGGKARGEACMRVKKAGGKLPEVKKEKSLGGAYAM